MDCSTELKCTIKDYKGEVRSVTIVDPRWEMTFLDMLEMYASMLLALGFDAHAVNEVLRGDE